MGEKATIPTWNPTWNTCYEVTDWLPKTALFDIITITVTLRAANWNFEWSRRIFSSWCDKNVFVKTTKLGFIYFKFVFHCFQSAQQKPKKKKKYPEQWLHVLPTFRKMIFFPPTPLKFTNFWNTPKKIYSFPKLR